MYILLINDFLSKYSDQKENIETVFLVSIIRYLYVIVNFKMYVTIE